MNDFMLPVVYDKWFDTVMQMIRRFTKEVYMSYRLEKIPKEHLKINK